MPCSRASWLRSAPARLRKTSCAPHSIRAGAFGPSPRARPATTPCRIIMARSGRTITPSSQAVSSATGSSEGIEPIFNGMMQTAAYMDQRRLPELFCGFPRRRSRGPTLYPVACSPQAWASGAVFQLVQAVLGLEYDLSTRAIRLRNPAVPMSVGHITVRNMRLGDAAISFTVRPDPNGTFLSGCWNPAAKSRFRWCWTPRLTGGQVANTRRSCQA